MTVVAAKPERTAGVRCGGQACRKGLCGGQVIFVDPGEWVLFVHLPAEAGHWVVQPSDDAEGLQVDDGPVVTRFGHAVEQALFEDDWGRRGGGFFGRADVVGDATKDNLGLTLIVLFGNSTGAEVRCAALPVVAQDGPDGLVLFTWLDLTILARAAATSVFGMSRVNASAVCRWCRRNSGATP